MKLTLLLSALDNLWTYILLGGLGFGIISALYIYFTLKTKQGTVSYAEWRLNQNLK